MRLQSLLQKCADYVLGIQQDDGSFTPGHNGPWHDMDTPVRVTAHWAMLLAHVYRNCVQSAYREAAKRCASYLTSKRALPHEIAFHFRQTKSKTNGLLKRLFCSIDFMKGLVCGNLDIDGQPLNLNRVLNQQNLVCPAEWLTEESDPGGFLWAYNPTGFARLVVMIFIE